MLLNLIKNSAFSKLTLSLTVVLFSYTCTKPKEPGACLMSASVSAPAKHSAYQLADSETILAQGFLQYFKQGESNHLDQKYLSAKNQLEMQDFFKREDLLTIDIIPVTVAIAKTQDTEHPYQIRVLTHS